MTFQLAGDSPDVYEKIMVPLWFERRADALIDVLALRPGENVLDVVCGMGVETGSRQDALNIEGRLGPEAVPTEGRFADLRCFRQPIAAKE